jgi:multiple sugar transport system substrate-binding protein
MDMGLLGCFMSAAQARQALTVAAFVAVEAVVRAAILVWKQIHPNASIQVVSLRLSNHHRAMTPALGMFSSRPPISGLPPAAVQ